MALCGLAELLLRVGMAVRVQAALVSTSAAYVW